MQMTLAETLQVGDYSKFSMKFTCKTHFNRHLYLQKKSDFHLLYDTLILYLFYAV